MCVFTVDTLDFTCSDGLYVDYFGFDGVSGMDD